MSQADARTADIHEKRCFAELLVPFKTFSERKLVTTIANSERASPKYSVWNVTSREARLI